LDRGACRSRDPDAMMHGYRGRDMYRTFNGYIGVIATGAALSFVAAVIVGLI
jgi:hypothetical protein